MTNGDQHGRNRYLDLAMIVVFDIAGPLVAYSLLRSAGQSAVTALVLSGVLPALGVITGLIRNRRADSIGVLVLAGIAVGTILGLISGNPRVVLVEGSVPTAVFGLLCLGSLWASRPLIYRSPSSSSAPTPRRDGTSRPSGSTTASVTPSGSTPWSGASRTWPRRRPGSSSSRRPRPAPR